MSFIKNFVKGVFIGAGAILPGISSGVICVSLGIYEKLVDSILSFFKDSKKNFKFLFPIMLGTIVGIFVFGNVLKYIFINYTSQTKIVFLILILCSIPSIIKRAKVNKIKVKHILSLLLTFTFSTYLVILEKNVSISYDSSTTFLSLILSGFIMSAGIVVPGISSTIILMLLGKYSIYLSAISNLDLSILFPMVIGIFIGSVLLLMLIKLLLKKYSDITFFAIIGFVLGSLLILF